MRRFGISSGGIGATVSCGLALLQIHGADSRVPKKFTKLRPVGKRPSLFFVFFSVETFRGFIPASLPNDNLFSGGEDLPDRPGLDPGGFQVGSGNAEAASGSSCLRGSGSSPPSSGWRTRRSSATWRTAWAAGTL